MELMKFESMEVPKLPPVLVEDSFRLAATNFGKRIMEPVDDPTADNLGKSGEKELRVKGERLLVCFDVDLDEQKIIIQYWPRGRGLGIQDLFLESVVTPFGIRSYLTCNSCGRMASFLHLRPDWPHWACRECLNLVHEVKTFDKRTTIGTLGYLLNRYLKLDEKKEKVKHAVYDGKLTRKARAALKFAQKLAPGLRGLK